MAETCEWLDLVYNCVYYARHARKHLPGTALLNGFQSPGGALKSTKQKKVLSICTFIWNKGPLNIWNDHKTQKSLVRRTLNIFS